MTDPVNRRQTIRIINMVIQFFLETFVGMVLGYFIGRQLDLWVFDDRQVFVFIFIVFGVFAGLRNLIVRALKETKGENTSEKH
jgi:F0F1-type ATP synthase assembly protein I